MFYIGPNAEYQDCEASDEIGKIVAGALNETFSLELSYWSVADYANSWRRELRQLVQERDVAVLFTVALPPDRAEWLRGYTMYRFDDMVRIHEKLFMGPFPAGFSLFRPGLMARPYSSHDEAGARLSEWAVSLDDVANFLDMEQ